MKAYMRVQPMTSVVAERVSEDDAPEAALIVVSAVGDVQDTVAAEQLSPVMVPVRV